MTEVVLRIRGCKEEIEKIIASENSFNAITFKSVSVKHVADLYTAEIYAECRFSASTALFFKKNGALLMESKIKTLKDFDVEAEIISRSEKSGFSEYIRLKDGKTVRITKEIRKVGDIYLGGFNLDDMKMK